MVKNTFNNPILKGWLNVYVIINIIYFIYLWGYFFIAGKLSANLSLETSLCAVLCITNIIGIVYLKRSFRTGVYFLFLVPITILLTQFCLIDNISISIYISLLLSIITSLLLFIKNGDSTTWAQMNKGFDIMHFKHIYQLTSIIILIILGYGVYNYIVLKDNSSNNEAYDEDLLNKYSSEELLRELDMPTITLRKISKIEKIIREIPPEYEARIMALRHILSGHIVANSHDIKAFKMAYFLRKDALSKEQQEILDWFFRQHNDVKEIWRTSDGCNNLASFREYIKAAIKKRKLIEF